MRNGGLAMKIIQLIKNKINIKSIEKDLIAVDSNIFSDSEKTRKMIKALICLRPNIVMRRTYKAELRKEIEKQIVQLQYKKKPISLFEFLRSHKKILSVSTATCVMIAVVMSVVLRERINEFYSNLVGKGDWALADTSPLESSDSLKLFQNDLSSDQAVSGFDNESSMRVSVRKNNDNIQNLRWAPSSPSTDEPLEIHGGGRIGLLEKKEVLSSETYKEFNTESYNLVIDNDFLDPAKTPLSTFSVDVDKASYSNVRRFINSGVLPPKDAVRIEEMINYFSYEYKSPSESEPFSVNTEIGTCPWNPQNKIMLVGLQGKILSKKEKLPSNIVFLIDSSGSMNSPEKMGLLKKSYKMLIEKLDKDDHVSIVAYAGSAGVILEPTSGNKKDKIIAALDRIESGGSTAGGEGIELAYKVAEKNFNKKGNNRIIIATDGDFNVGASSDAEMVRLIESKRNKGIFISVIGFGMGNYKDSKMEMIADKGNGNYFYIDTVNEAKKVMIEEMDSMLFTIAKDVKVQVEFNPVNVASYRLIGYENRVMNAEDFNDDKKDAGEIGAGHSVTALYEIVPRNNGIFKWMNTLRYQQIKSNSNGEKNKEIALIKLRYKQPQGERSQLIEYVVNNDLNNASANLYFASAVAEFGMLLRDSQYKAKSSFASLIMRAELFKGNDKFGYRREFINLAKKAKAISSSEEKK
jgi:Ca-activated chloride channel family protein